MIHKTVFVKCPYCGNTHTQCLAAEHFGTEKMIATCEVQNETDKPGCGKDFVIKFETKLETKLYRIEGK